MGPHHRAQARHNGHTGWQVQRMRVNGACQKVLLTKNILNEHMLFCCKEAGYFPSAGVVKVRGGNLVSTPPNFRFYRDFHFIISGTRYE